MTRTAYTKSEPSAYHFAWRHKRTGIIGVNPLYHCTPYSSNLSTSLDTSKTRIGELLPEWREIIAEGGDATTNLNQNMTKVEYVKALRLEADWEAVQFRGLSCHTSIFNEWDLKWPFSIDASLENDVVNLAYGKCYAELARNFETLPFLKDLTETVSTIKNLREALFRKLRKFREVAFDARERNAWYNGIRTKPWAERIDDYRQEISKRWLEYQFGIKPMLSDLDDLIKAFHLAKARERGLTFKVGAVQNKLHAEKDSAHYGVDGFGWKRQRTGSSISRVKIQGKAALKLQFDQDIPRTFGLSPEHWIPSAWELLPYSWAIDYFTNTGTVISAVCTSAMFDVLSAWQTTSTTTETLVDIPSLTATAPKAAILTFSPGQARFTRKSVRRVPLVTIPVPYLVAKTRLSANQGANLVAVLQKWYWSDRQYAKKFGHS